VTSVRSHDKVIASATRQCLIFSLYKRTCTTGYLALVEQCGPILLYVWGSDVSITEVFYNASDQESLPSVLWVKPGDQVKKWVPHIVCNTLEKRLSS